MRTIIAAILVCSAVLSGCGKEQPNKPGPDVPPGSTTEPPVSAAPTDNGCWVQIWEDENFQDDNDIIRGPGRWNNMRNLPGANKTDWGDEIDSLKVGPRATVRVWEDENFGDNSATYGPGTEKTNLRGDPDLGDNIDSMEITCA